MGSGKGSFVIGDHRNTRTSNSKSENAEHVEKVFPNGSGPAIEATRMKTFRQKFQRHWRRFWCLYLVATIIFLAVFLPVFFLVAIPAIAQKIVDDTDLPIYSAKILDPKPDEVSFTLETSLKVPLGLRIHTDPLDLDLFNKSVTPMKPYLTVSLPSYNLKGTTDISVTRNNTKILDHSEFIETLKTAVYNKKFTLSAKGSTIGHLGALKAPLTLRKDIELNGLDKLSGFFIESARILLPKESDGTNLVGTANLPNHSLFTFALGNVTLNLKTANLVVGQATIRDVLLQPGDNKVSLRGYLNISTVIDNLEVIMDAQKTALQDGEIELSATGNSTVFNGVHIEYYERILNNLTLTARVSILAVLGDTLQGLIENKNSSLGNVIRNVTSILGDVAGSKNLSSVIQSL